MAWATYAAPVANEIQHCMALIPVSQDLCNVTQAALDFCVTSTVSGVCTTDLANATCAVLAGTCTTLDVSACQKRISADLGYDSAAFAACLVTSTVTDCNAKILGCI